MTKKFFLIAALWVAFFAGTVASAQQTRPTKLIENIEWWRNQNAQNPQLSSARTRPVH
jgi:Ni/Co efflux regulator RcnB